MQLSFLQLHLSDACAVLVRRDLLGPIEFSYELSLRMSKLLQTCLDVLCLSLKCLYLVPQVVDVEDVLLQLVAQSFLFFLHPLEGFVAFPPLAFEELSSLFLGAAALPD